jgi:uncharacterized membrane protein YjjP (DUF1212 family)
LTFVACDNTLFNDLSFSTTMTPENQSGAEDPRIVFVIKLGQALHRYGVPSYRLEHGMNLVAQTVGVTGNFFVTPTGIFASFGLPQEQRTALIRTESSEVNLEKMALLDGLVNRVISGEVSIREGSEEIDRIVNSPSRYHVALIPLSFAVSSGAAARVMGGGSHEVVIAGMIGSAVGVLAALMGHSKEAGRLFEAFAAILASAFVMVAAHFFSPFQTTVTILASLIVLLPGLTLTVAMHELATRNLVSGTARLMGATLVLFQIGFGVALGSQIVRILPALPQAIAPVSPPGWSLWIALFLAPASFTVLFQAHPRDMGWILIACLLGFAGARAGAYFVGPELGVCIGALVLGAGGNLYATHKNRPAGIPIVPGLIMLVPGSLGVGSLARFIANDTFSAIQLVFSMILIAVALVTGLLMANVLVPPRKAL